MKITIIIQIQSTARSSIIKINIGSFKKKRGRKGKKVEKEREKRGEGKKRGSESIFPSN